MAAAAIKLHDIAGTTIKLSTSNGRNYLWFMQPSDTDEQRYAPAESIEMFLSDAQVKELGEWLIAQVETPTP